MAEHASKQPPYALSLGALGVVFGDIGTSPLYAFKECLQGPHGASPSEPNVLGVLSLIFWSITFVVSIKYLAVITRADNRGEGGIFALLALLPERPQTKRALNVFVVLGVVGAALLYGDGVITPAISVLSAIEGLESVAPGLERAVVPLTCATLLALFALQPRGTHKIGRLFGPVMLIWFTVIGALGAVHVARNPLVLAALSPTHAVAFFAQHGLHGALILGAVVLAVTGAEALYADLGHFGVRPIRLAWFWIVLPALLLAYFGQGALVLREPANAANPFFAMVPSGMASLGMVVLASFATVIASQALISGVFSLTQQAVQLGYLPRLMIRHTAYEAEGQVYVPIVNQLLALSCVALVIGFRASTRLASAYGIAVSGTMVITSIVFFEVSRRRWTWPLWAAGGLLVFFLAFDVPFLLANTVKILDGGYIPIGIGAVFVTIMLVWKSGQLRFAELLAESSEPLARFAARAEAELVSRVRGTGVFVTRSAAHVPPAMLRQVHAVPVLQDTVLVVTVTSAHTPFVPAEERCTVLELPHGFYQIGVCFGFMESPRLPEVLAQLAKQRGFAFEPEWTTYYLQRETYLATRAGKMGPLREGLFSLLSRNARPADAYLHIPPTSVVEIGAQFDL